MWHQNIAGMCHGTTVSGDFFQFKSELIAAVAAAAAASQASVCVCVSVWECHSQLPRLADQPSVGQV